MYASPEIIREFLDYDPETGLFCWHERDLRHFPEERQQLAWNAKYAGKPAFFSKHNRGYLYGRIFMKAFLAHRVAWCHYHGKWPDDQIDHINGIREDNRIINLRDVPVVTNRKNVAVRDSSKSGVPGVIWIEAVGRWRANISHKGERLYLGEYQSLEKAIAVRKAKEKEFGYHPNHGRNKKTPAP